MLILLLSKILTLKVEKINSQTIFDIFYMKSNGRKRRERAKRCCSPYYKQSESPANRKKIKNQGKNTLTINQD